MTIKNSVHLIGRLTKTPELTQTQGGLEKTSFCLAVSRGKVAEGKQDTDFIYVNGFGKLAEFVCNYFNKGDIMGVEGRLQARSYEDNDGVSHRVTDVLANTIDFITPKSAASSGELSPGSGVVRSGADLHNKKAEIAAKEHAFEDDGDESDDDFPF